MRPTWLLLLSALLACGAPPEAEDPAGGGGKEDRASGAVLRFTADYREELSGGLRAGEQLRVEYALERLPDCRGSSGGRPQWTITGFYAVDAGAPRAFEVSRVEGDDRVAQAALLDIPSGTDLAFWFQVTNRWGCNAYDSDFGNNYHFAPGASSGGQALLAFPASGALTQQGVVRAGGKVTVRYALDRLPDCRGSSGGRPQWTITGFASVDGSEVRTFEVSRVEGNDRVPVDALLDVAGGETLSLWFQATNRWGCSAFDSNAGANYELAIGR